MSDNNKPLITISITMYNNPDGLKKTIPSIMMQDYTNAQIIMSDDGSTKYDKSILNSYADQLRTKFKEVCINLLPENGGTVKHMNKVVSIAKGEYLLDLSPGDEFHSPDTVSTVVDTFIRTGKLIITSKRADVYSDGHFRARPHFYTGMLLKYFPKQFLNYMLKKRNTLSGCGTFYSMELFKKYGPFDEQYKLVEDFTYYTMLLSKGAKFGWINKITVNHEMGGVSNGEVHPLVYSDIELLKKNYGITK